MNYWKKRLGWVHLMDHNTTRCGIPMLGNNYAIDSDVITCEKCKTFIKLDSIKSTSVTDYYSALYKAAVLKLSDFTDNELEAFLEYKRKEK